MMWPFGPQRLKQDLKQTNLEYPTSAPCSQNQQMSVCRNCFILPFFFNEWGMRQIPSTNTVLVLTTSCTTLNSGRSRLWLVAGVNRHLPCSRLGARLWRRKKRTSGRCCPHRWRRSNIRSPSPTARSVVRIWKITCESLIKFHWWSEASQLQLGYMCRKLSCSFRFDHLKLKYWCIFLWGSKIIV